jgi:protease IV
VEEIRKSVPVIVSMGGVAASGGYCMACGADRIFADNMTITGSIGIISGKFAFGGMLDSLGINMEEVSTGPMAGMYTPFRRFTDPERQRVIELMHDGYDLFVQTVADGRNMTYEEVDSIGRGRVWAGSDALEIGLVDQIGGVADAVMYAASQGGLDPNEIPRVLIYPTPSFPGNITAPGLGVTSHLMELLVDQQYMYLMRPLELD